MTKISKAKNKKNRGEIFNAFIMEIIIALDSSITQIVKKNAIMVLRKYL